MEFLGRMLGMMETGASRGRTAIHRAIDDDRQDILEWLVTKGEMDVNGGGAVTPTPLCYAVLEKKPEMLQKLLSLGADPMEGKSGWIPLQAAAQNDYGEGMRILLEARPGADHVNKRRANGCTAALIAAEHGSLQALRFLVEHHGADLNICCNNGGTPLIYAACHNNTVGCMRYLSKRPGAEEFFNRVDTDGDTALHVAVLKNTRAALSALVEIGLSDPFIRNKKGLTAADIARDKNRPALLLQLTEYMRSKLNKPGALERAVAEANTGLLRFAERKAADKLRNARGLLHKAVEAGQAGVIEILAPFVLLDACDAEGRTPLALAASRGDVDSARALIAAGADVAITDAEGRTPLYLAAEAGHHAMVLYLKTKTDAGLGGRTAEGLPQNMRDLLEGAHDDGPPAKRQRTLDTTCVVCLDKSATHAFVPCGHKVVCQGCSKAYTGTGMECAVCRREVTSVLRIY